MKKIFCLMLVMLIQYSAVACSHMPSEYYGEPNTEQHEDVLSQIYEIRDQSFGTEADDCTKHRNLILSDIEVSSKKEVGEKKIIHILEKDLNLTYQQTEFHPIGDIEFHNYSIDGAQNSRVLLKEDGTIQEIVRVDIAKLDISPKETPESVQQKLEAALSRMVDFSLYQFINSEPALKSDGTYYSYSFSYYNEINGYTSDVLFLLVEGKGDGTVRALRYSKPLPKLTEQDLQITEDHEDKILQIKLKDMYTVTDSDHLTYEVTAAAIAMYKGEVHIKYRVYTDVLRSSSNTKDGYVCDLLIPLNLLTEN